MPTASGRPYEGTHWQERCDRHPLVDHDGDRVEAGAKGMESLRGLLVGLLTAC